MPYRSSKQRAWMHIHIASVARAWDSRYGGKIRPKKKRKKEVKDARS